MRTPVETYNALQSLPGSIDYAWLSALVSNLPQAVVLEDENHTIRIANQQFCDIFHLTDPPDEIRGKASADLYNRVAGIFENDDNYRERIKVLVKEKKPARKEVVKMKDGRMLLRDYIPLWQNGILTGHMWMFSEETERIRAEALLQEQQKFYEDILNSIPSDIAVFSPEQRYLYINPVGVRDPELRKWLIGKDDFDYCRMRGKDISLAEKRRQVFNDIINGGKEREWEERMVNKRGEVEYHLRKMSPLYDQNGQLVWVIGYSVNITERKKFEEKIQFSEKRYRDLFNFSQAIICTHDGEGNFLSVNPAMVEVLGYEQSEIIGRNLKDFLLPEDRAGVDELYLKLINTNPDNKVKGLFRILHKSGRKVYLLYQNYKVQESADSPGYIIGFAQDVSDRIKIEKELKVAKQITEETARNKERFLANMSHEIRTPMNGIIGITSYLQNTALTGEQRNYLTIIQESAHDLLTIINDILDLEKIGTGKILLEKIPFDILAKTVTVIRLFEINARTKGVNIEFRNNVSGKLCVVGDPTRFYQAMNNLISNAVKFTHQGRITVSASVEEETDNDIRLRFSVQDTGIGIDISNINRIFQPFTQAYAETTRKYGGSGLGLAITKNLVELQGGKIWVESQPLRGSSFHFSITYRKCSKAQIRLLEPTPVIKNQLGKLNILVAEDNKVNQLLTSGMLEHLGMNVKLADTGNKALQLIEQETFDVVLMDIQMPEKNGFEATRAIRSMENNANRFVPIVALTASTSGSDIAECEAAGMNGHLTKPFTESALYDTISSVLEKTSQQNTSSANQEKMQTETTGKLYDLSLVNELARGNQEFIVNLAKIFIETVPPTAAEMVNACEQKKWEQVGKLAHKLKSTIDTMCISSLKDDIRVIEKNGKDQKNLESIPSLVEKTSSVISSVTAQLKAEFSL